MKGHWQQSALLLTLLISSCGQDESDITFAEPWPDRIDLKIIDSIGVENGDSNYVFGAIYDTVTTPKASRSIKGANSRDYREGS